MLRLNKILNQREKEKKLSGFFRFIQGKIASSFKIIKRRVEFFFSYQSTAIFPVKRAYTNN